MKSSGTEIVKRACRIPNDNASTSRGSALSGSKDSVKTACMEWVGIKGCPVVGASLGYIIVATESRLRTKITRRNCSESGPIWFCHLGVDSVSVTPVLHDQKPGTRTIGEEVKEERTSLPV